jgi:osmotically-inducible protein OsmY
MRLKRRRSGTGVKAVADEIIVELPFERTRGDEDIAAATIERLAWDTSVPPDAIAVKVEQGRLTLTGHVALFYQKQAAGQDVARLHGVTGVSNQIAVRSAVDVSDISDKIRLALRRSWLLDVCRFACQRANVWNYWHEFMALSG